MSQFAFRISLAVLLPTMFVLLIAVGAINNPFAQLQFNGMGPLLFALYFFPAIIAAVRGHPNKNAICVLNIFLGWTILGWIVALVWASTYVAPPSQGSL